MMACENAYLKKNKYYCKIVDYLCPHVYFCGMRGKWELNEHAEKCPRRKDEKNG